MILAADNLNPLNPTVSRALADLDPEPVRELTRRLTGNGATLIDINPGPLSAKKEDRLDFLIETVQSVTDARLILDSPRPRLLARGLKLCDRPPVLSALTAEPAKLEGILPLAKTPGVDLVILLLDEHSLCPVTVEQKLSLALELWGRATQAGIPADRLIFDPVMPNLAWPDAMVQLGAAVNATRQLGPGAILGEPARTMAGISNLRSGVPARFPLEIEARTLAVLAGAGLDVALINVLSPHLLETVKELSYLS